MATDVVELGVGVWMREVSSDRSRMKKRKNAQLIRPSASVMKMPTGDRTESVL